jgi:Tfp pilus assembly protein PilN
MSVLIDQSPESSVSATDFDLLAPVVYIAPRANLLPPEIAQRAALRRTQAVLAAAVLACGGIVGAMYVTADNGRAPARAALAEAQTEQSSLAAQQGVLAPSQVAHQKVLSARQSLVDAMGSEVLWSAQLDALRSQLPAGVRLSSLAITPAVATAGSTPTAVQLPAAPAGSSAASTTGGAATTATASSAIAAVTMTGVAVDLDAVAGWLDQLAGLPGWSDIYLSSTSASAGARTVTYSITASVTDKALSHRYTNGSQR